MCVSACIVEKEAEESRNRVVINSEMKSSPIFCRHCDLPECAYTCMSGAMRKDMETGNVLYDKEKCTSCYMCVMACPYGVLRADARTKKEILKCDMCKDNPNGPNCVAKCPMGAITVEEVDWLVKYVVIGASAAGINGAENLRRLDKEGKITLISKDEKIYSRCILHHYISGSKSVEKLNFAGEDFFEKDNIKWIKGQEVVGLKEEKKVVILEDGREIGYDKLLIASGSKPFIPPIENLRGKSNVKGLKTLDDCEDIIRLAKEAKNIAVIGAGLIGLDAVTGLLHSEDNNSNISLIETLDRLLPTQLDKKSSYSYERELTKEGVSLYLNAMVESAVVDSSDKVVSLKLKDKREIQVDLVVVATGIRSNIEFLEGTSLKLSRCGLEFNEKGETNVENIYGAGDVSGVATIWPVAVKEGIIATTNMTGRERVMDDFFTSKATMNFFGIPTLSLGDSAREKEEMEEERYTVDILMDNEGNYKKIVHKEGVIYGAIIQGDLSYAGILTQLIRAKINISKIRKPIFNIDYSDFFNINEKLEFEY